MKIYNWIVLGALLFLGNSFVLKAQDVHIMIPAQNIFNHTEFTTVQTVMNTNGFRYWKWDYLPRGAVYPTVRAMQSANFKHNSIPGVHLPSAILQWRLASIGGQIPPFQNGDVWPGFKHFTTSDQNWFEPFVWNEPLPPGNIDFTFKISAGKFQNNLFPSGTYVMEITHNYGQEMASGNNEVFFTPSTFYIYITIPKGLSWLTTSNVGYKEINSLNQFRGAPSQVDLDLLTFELGSTINFNLFAKSASSTIQFISSKGDQETRDISLLRLEGSNPKINTLPLSSTWQDLTGGNNFTVENGNNNNFQLHTSISQVDFKNYFFQAGTYKFQVNLNAKSTDNSVTAHHNVDYTLKVQTLSEISIPNLGHEVNFEFNTAAQYQNGQTKIIPNQLKLSNNEAYELYVKSDVAFFKRTGIQSTVPASILQVGVDGGSQQVSLSTIPQKILSNGAPVLDKDLNMKYTIPSNAAQTLVVKEKSTYSIHVIITIRKLKFKRA